MLSAGSLGPGLLRVNKASRRACRMQLLETPGAKGKGRSSVKEARSVLTNYLRLRPLARSSMLPARTVDTEIFKVHKERRRACRLRLLVTPGAFQMGRSNDKERESRVPTISTRPTHAQAF